MNLGRGFFRIWIVFAFLWVCLGCALVWQNGALQRLAGTGEVIVPLGEKNVAIGQGAVESELDEIFDATRGNRFAKYNPARLAQQESERAQFKVAVHERIQSIPNEVAELAFTSVLFLSVPIFLLGLGKLLKWIGMGFRSSE